MDHRRVKELNLRLGLADSIWLEGVLCPVCNMSLAAVACGLFGPLFVSLLASPRIFMYGARPIA